MAVTEFALIDHYFARIGATRPDVVLGVGDDGALLAPPTGGELVSASRTLHPDPASGGQGPAALARGLAAGVLTDIALARARPAWATLALSLPAVDESWLEGFAGGLDEVLGAADVGLVGGDTTRGPWRVTLGAHGQRPAGKPAPRRAWAGDLVYVSGELGAQGLALLDRYGEIQLPRGARDLAHHALDHPRPPLEALLALADASAVATLEDGLAPALARLLGDHGLGATLYADSLPAAPELLPFLDWVGGRDFLLSGSSGLTLAMVVTADDQAAFEGRCAGLGLACHWVGLVEHQPGVRCDA